jgi:tetratricopeptide (TPR) repeat protein
MNPSARIWLFACGVAAGAWLLLPGAPATRQQIDLLWHHRNLGKAFYENPTTQKEAVAEFKKALEMQPDSVRERVNYGLALIKAGETQAGIAELEKAQKQDPSVPHTWFNLGILAKKDGNSERAIEQLQGMEKLVPGDPKARYNLGVLYKQEGKKEEALKELEEAERLDPNFAAPRLQLFNLYRSLNRSDDAKRELAVFQKIKAQQAGAPVPEDAEANNYSEIWDPIDIPPEATVPVNPKYSDQIIAEHMKGFAPTDREHVLAWDDTGAAIYPGNQKILDAGDIVSVEPGDFDNDGKFDLCVIRKSGVELYRNNSGKYEKVDSKLPSGRFERAIWLDYDHDNDMDLVLLGEDAALLRNSGSAGFTDETKSFPFEKGHAIDAVRWAQKPEVPARDLVVSYADHAGILYRDKLNGVFEAVPVAALPAGARGLAVEDFNHDSYLDVRAGDLGLKNDGSGLVASSGAIFEHELFSLDANGAIHSAAATPESERWLNVQIKGIKNVKLAVGSTIEVRSGALYQKKVYQGIPLRFQMNNYADADTIRITWVNGLIQNEPQKRTNQAVSFDEAQRLSGSCPMIFTWNGHGFEFITDVLGVAPLGASSGDGQYFPVDHDEYIQIPGEKLQAKDGKLEVRITEELREVSYLDQVRLIAVDHPESEEIFTNDKFKSPPFPEFRLYGVKHRIYPMAAHDSSGRDVLSALLQKDRVYPDGFRRNYEGVAETHALTLDFGKSAADNNAVLVLNGWVDWADGSTFLGAAQESKGGLVLPYLQVKDANGEWKTVIEDMGIPAGKPKTISVDLKGKFLSPSREVRIVTNLCVYWDEIFLAEHAATPQVVLTKADALSADLHFRGFSRPVIDPQRKQPEQFLYADWMPVSMWNPTAGLYTRYGDVRELVTGTDDKLTIMGSGDELTLEFPTDRFPRLPRGWKRDYLLLVDGWAKDADANTAFSQSVEPLPFHGMSAYPYRPDEHFPDDAVHRDYRKKYLTRPALRLIRPLT